MLTELPLLSLLIWAPIVMGSLLLISNWRIGQRLFHWIAVVCSLLCLVLAGVLIYNFNTSIWQFQFVEYINWLPMLGIKYAIGVDGISLLLILLTCLMTFLVLVFALKEQLTHSVQYFAAFLIMQGLLCGVFASLDAILFYMFFEAMLIPMFLIIGIWGGSNRVYATIKFFLFTVVGSIALLVSLIYLLIKVNMLGVNEPVFSIASFPTLSLSMLEQQWLFFGLLLAFAIKLPMLPVHTWLPDAHVEAPTGGSVILAAIILKVGGYGILRLVLPVVPGACLEFANIILVLAIGTIIYISLITIVQKDLKKLIAYSSIVHMGLVLLGLFVIFKFADLTNLTENIQQTYNVQQASMHNIDYIQQAIIGMEGAIIHMIAHGLIVGALFLCVGVLIKKIGSRNIEHYGGMVNYMPKFAVFFMLFALANIGLPGTMGFVGEFLILLAAVKVHFWYAVLAGSIFVLSVVYILWMYKQVMFGKANKQIVSKVNEQMFEKANKQILKKNDIYWNEFFVFIVLGVIIVLFGFWPEPILHMIREPVQHLGEVILRI